MQKAIKPTESEWRSFRYYCRKPPQYGKYMMNFPKPAISAYTTALNLLQIMFEKGSLPATILPKHIFIYLPYTREKTQKQLVGKMISTLFSGSSTELVMQALGNQQTSKEELDEIQKMLDNLRKEK